MVMEVIQALAILGSVIASVLAWLAKLQWSKEFKDAKAAQITALERQIQSLQSAHDERIKAKEEQISTLQDKLKTLEELNSQKTQEYFQYTKSQLEKYNDTLKVRVQELESEIKDNKIDEAAKSTETLKKLLKEGGELVIDAGTF